LPTAKQLVALEHHIPSNSVPREPLGFGLATIDHWLPSQCSANVWVSMFGAVLMRPTALQFAVL